MKSRSYEAHLAALRDAIGNGVAPAPVAIQELYRFGHPDADRDAAQLFYQRRLLEEERLDLELDRARTEWLARELPDDPDDDDRSTATDP